MKVRPITGAGGGKGGGEIRLPKEAPDTLQSRAYARLVDLISEGPIEGFVTKDGFLCQDATFTLPFSLDDDGSIVLTGTPTYAADSTITHLGGTPVFDGGSGYPGYYTYAGVGFEYVRCNIEGDGSGAEILVILYPRTTAERAAAGLPDSVPIHPEGKPRGVYVADTGLGYKLDTTRITLPSSVGQAIFFDDVPLNDPANLSPNYSDITLQYRFGTEDQSVMRDFDQVEETISVNSNSEITPLAPFDYLIENNPDYDRLRINLSFYNGLYLVDKEDGDIRQISQDSPIILEIKQYYAEAGIAITESSPSMYFGQGTYYIYGKTLSAYERTIEAPLFKPDPTKNYNWKIVVKRITETDTDFKTANSGYDRGSEFRVSSLTAINQIKLSYPFCAIVGVQINAEQFSHIPTRAYNVRMTKVSVPTNYVPRGTLVDVYDDGEYVGAAGSGPLQRRYQTATPLYNRSESGKLEYVNADTPAVLSWDGDFYEAWTDNPAWVFYYICTNERVGLGSVMPPANKWLLYQIAKYCDEMVSTGYSNGAFTSKEPRFTCNVFFQTKEEAYRVLSDIATTFAGFTYYAGGQVIPVLDAPRPVRMNFTPANVEHGIFTYRGTTRKVRHTVALIKYNDPDNGYKLAPMYYEDTEGLIRYGVQTLEKTALGCTSKGQARRMAKRLIRQELSNTDTVSFVTGLQGSILRPGDVIAVFDPARASVRFGGRILAINAHPDDGSALLTLDSPLLDWDANGATAASYSLFFITPTGELNPDELTTSEDIDKMMRSQVSAPYKIASFSQIQTSIDEEPRTIVKLAGQAGTSVPEGVTVGSIWGLTLDTIKPQYFTVLGIEELEKFRFSVTGIEYHEALYAEIDSDVPYSEEPINPDPTQWRIPGPPENLNLEVKVLMVADGTRTYKLHASWSKPKTGFAKAYRVSIKRNLANYQFATETPEFSVEFVVEPANTYYVQVRSVGFTGALSRPATANKTIDVDGGDDGSGTDTFISGKEIVSGLEIKGQAHDHKFYTGDLQLDWRVNWSTLGRSFEDQSGIIPTLGATIAGYLLRLYDVDDNKVLEERPISTDFTLSVDRNRQLTGGPHRELLVEIYAATYDGKYSAPTRIRVLNEQPPVPVGVTISDNKQGAVVLRFPRSTALDFAGYRVWMSETQGFTPSADNLVYEGTSLITPGLSVAGAPEATTYYIRYAEFDLLSRDVLDCIISAEASQAVTGDALATVSVFDFLNRS